MTTVRDYAPSTSGAGTTPPQPPTAAAAAVASEEIVVVNERPAASAVDVGGDRKSRSAGSRDAVGRENWRLAQHGVNSPASDGCRATAAAAKVHSICELTEQDSLDDHFSHINRKLVQRSSKMGRSNGLKSSRTLMNILTSRGTDMLQHTEPFHHFWVTLSSLYGMILVILMFAICLIEVMDNPVKLLSIQGIYLMYLYLGSIAVIICIYVWVLIDSCVSLTSDETEIVTSDSSSPGVFTLNRFNSLKQFSSLKRAHISRSKTSDTSFYLRVGALVFGLGTLVFNGLEMAMYSMMDISCLNDVIFVHPILHGLFTFLQMHFLFINSQVLVERFGLAARFGFMHLAATNIALWVRLVIWESGIEWIYFIHLAQTSNIGMSASTYESSIPTPLQLRGFPSFITSRHTRDLKPDYNGTFRNSIYQPVSENHVTQVVTLHHCLNTNSLGQLLTSSMPYLYPFIVQFSLIAAGVTYVMGQNVGTCQVKPLKRNTQKPPPSSSLAPKDPQKDSAAQLGRLYVSQGVSFSGANKGLFLGLLTLVMVIVVVIIFLVVKDDADFATDTLFWMTSTTLATILSTGTLLGCVGLYQVRKLCHNGNQLTALDTMLATVSSAGVVLYALFSVMVGAVGVATSQPDTPEQKIDAMLTAVNVLQLVHVAVQSSLTAEAYRRSSWSRHQMFTKPGRQVITYLLCSNIALWMFDSFITQSWLNQERQLRFMGLLSWGLLSRISLPLVVFYRFHSGVLLLQIWQKSYR
ncbi:proton channel OtopLc-like isoform X2 [Aphis gossypii]|uniref:proton channel OtopLc-like isoform X2 n=1 Tax=Aphis gossypii TaxID=80765 RepID=UPI0021597517|nr:proton channel OtopLc-like isoform X2 [Aphis gossypii]